MNNLGNTLKEMSYLDEAIHYYKMAIEAPNPMGYIAIWALP